MRHNRTARLATGTLLLVLAACAPLAPKHQPPANPTPTASPSLPPLKFTGHGTAKRPVRWIQQKANRKQYELLARSYESMGSEGSARATFHDVRVTFYAADGSSLVAAAPRALVDQAAKTVTLIGGVHAANSSGMTLTCDTLAYSARDEMIHGAGHVVAHGPNGLDATGNRIDTNISLTHIRMQ
ncbi:MAG: LPS export ABC transporter periplasmic protein LptC [Vulcanimicrobiaceae bacterium]